MKMIIIGENLKKKKIGTIIFEDKIYTLSRDRENIPIMKLK